MNQLEELHRKDLKALCAKVAQFHQQKKKFRIYHGSTNSTRTQKFNRENIVDISNFNRVLFINQKEKYALVEPNVPMDRLVAATLPYGLVPPVVMEFPGITVGGGVQGGAGESSSFKWGGFHHTCSEYEIVLGNGKVLRCSAKTNPDLYWGTACSYGTLGIITKIKVNLISPKKFIHLKYQRVSSFKNAVKLLEELVRTKVDFIDGIIFSKNFGVIMSGSFSDRTNLPVSSFTHPQDEWFYLHAEKKASEKEIYEEQIPLVDYFFRYNRGAFWVGKYAFTRGQVPFNRFTRFLFDPLFKTRTLYRFLQAINISQKQIVQDFILPRETVLDFMDYIDKAIGIYPLWLLPGALASKKDKLSPGFIKTKLGIDVGVWGKPEIKFKADKDTNVLIQLNRDIEKKLTELGGRKVLYAHQYYTEKEFWKIYDKDWYLGLRKKYFADAVFPDVYEKTFVRELYAVSFWKGILEVIRSPFRLPV